MLLQVKLEIDGRTQVLSGPGGEQVRGLLALLREDDFELPAGGVRGALLDGKEARAEYLAARERDRRDVHAYVRESRRRAEAGDVDGAVRVLSSVIEEHAGRGEALRLVGYRLLALGQPAQAARFSLAQPPSTAHVSSAGSDVHPGPAPPPRSAGSS